MSVMLTIVAASAPRIVCAIITDLIALHFTVAAQRGTGTRRVTAPARQDLALAAACHIFPSITLFRSRDHAIATMSRLAFGAFPKSFMMRDLIRSRSHRQHSGHQWVGSEAGGSVDLQARGLVYRKDVSICSSSRRRTPDLRCSEAFKD